MIHGNGQAISVGRSSSSCDGGISVGYSAVSNSVDTVLLGRNAAVGSSSDGSVVVGVGASGWGLGNVGVGSGVVVGTSLNPVEYSVAAGFECDVQESLSIAVGYQVSVALGAVNSVVVGQESTVGGSQSLVVGHLASSGVGPYNVVVGALSTVGGVGAANTLVGFACYVGDSVGETRDFGGNVRVGSGNATYANRSVVLGNNSFAGDTHDASIIGDCVVVGTWASVTGSYGQAYGLNASAGEHEVAFGDGVTNDGYVRKFHAVSDVVITMYGQSFSAAADSVFDPGVRTTLTSVGPLPVGLLNRQSVTISGSAHYDGTWYVSHVDRVANKFDISTAFVGDDSGGWANTEYDDLFSFDEARLTGPNTTVMTLVIKRSDGATVLNVPVTLSAPVGGVSILQVANS